MDKVRVIRVLVYEGSRVDVERTLAKGAVPANGRHVAGSLTISSMTISEFPEIIGNVEEEKEGED